ncbi:MAG: tetratricopeptide repeat protein [Syntrophales bacterium]
MSVILEALKRAQKARTDKLEGDRGFKIDTILSPVDFKSKRTMLLFKILGMGGGLIFLLIFIVLFFPSKKQVREEAGYKAQENLEVSEIIKPDTGGESGKSLTVMELQKPESIAPERSFPFIMDGEEVPVHSKIPEKELERKTDYKERKPELKTYVKKSLPAEESSEKAEIKRNEPQKQIPVELNPPQSAAYHFNLGVFYQGEGKLKEAKEEYEKVLSSMPSHVEAHNNLGVVYKDMGKLDMAIAKYSKAITLDPKYKKARYNLATTLYLKGDLDSAASESRLGIVLDPRDSEGYNILGLIYKKQDKTQEALEMFRKALAIDPGYPPTHYNMAITLEDLGNIPGAMFHYQKFVDLSMARGDNQTLVGKVVKHLKRLSS